MKQAISSRFHISGGTFDQRSPRVYRVEKDMVYTNEHGTIYVRKGTLTDLASTPKIVWSFLPPDGPYVVPAIIHDALYRGNYINPKTGSVFTRKEADDLFDEMMEFVGVEEDTRKKVYSAVRHFGWKAWDDAKRKTL